jgi:hypothetical protein
VIRIFLLSFAFIVGCSAKNDLTFGEPARFETNHRSKAMPASIISLLGRPEIYIDKLVAVEGFLAADWEGPILFLTLELCERYSSWDGIGIIMDPMVEVDWMSLTKPDCRLVLIQGYFRPLEPREPDPAVISLRLVPAVLERVLYLATIDDSP